MTLKSNLTFVSLSVLAVLLADILELDVWDQECSKMLDQMECKVVQSSKPMLYLHLFFLHKPHKVHLVSKITQILVHNKPSPNPLPSLTETDKKALQISVPQINHKHLIKIQAWNPSLGDTCQLRIGGPWCDLVLIMILRAMIYCVL